jgi:uncharacterized protein (DUF362 family)
MSLVSFVKIKNNNFKPAIMKALSLIDYDFRNDVEKIVIKPNMCYYWDYSTGQTTDPKFVGALIDVLRDKISPDVKISIVESDASAMKCKYAFKFLGYEKLAQNYNVNLINLSEDKCDNVDIAIGNHSFRLMLPQTIRDANLRINIPKIKYTFERIKLTCALKNIFGCNPYTKKFKYHSKIEEAIVALNKAMKFDLCIIDGNIVSAAKPSRIGLAMASEDPVAIDVAAARIAGINPKTVKYLSLAAKEGLGHLCFIQKGVPIDYFKARYPRKSPRQKLMGKAYQLVVTVGLNKKLGLA